MEDSLDTGAKSCPSRIVSVEGMFHLFPGITPEAHFPSAVPLQPGQKDAVALSWRGESSSGFREVQTFSHVRKIEAGQLRVPCA